MLMRELGVHGYNIVKNLVLRLEDFDHGTVWDQYHQGPARNP
jgi:hypothetical protein